MKNPRSAQGDSSSKTRQNDSSQLLTATDLHRFSGDLSVKIRRIRSIRVPVLSSPTGCQGILRSEDSAQNDGGMKSLRNLCGFGISWGLV